MKTIEKFENFIKQREKYFKKMHKPLEQNEFFATMASSCPRIIWYVKKYGYSIDMDTQKVFLAGSLLHDFFQKNIFRGKDYQIEEPIQIEKDGIIIRGRADIITPNSIIELKSCSWLPKEPSKKYLMQLNLYLSKNSHKTGVLTYISKNNLQLKEIEIKFDSELLRETLENFIIAYNNILYDELPLKIECEDCKYCNFKEKCEVDEK